MKLQKTSLIYIINANKGIETIVNCNALRHCCITLHDSNSTTLYATVEEKRKWLASQHLSFCK